MMKRRITAYTLASLCFFAVAALVVARPRSQNPSAGAGLEGKWEGQLGQGANHLRIVLLFTKLADGSWSGQLNSVDQGAVLPMSAVRIESSKIHFEIPAVGGVYEGEMNAAGTDITGSWTQTGVPAQPLSLHRAAAEPAQQPPAATTPAAPATKPLTAPLEIYTPSPPRAFYANGATHLAYELHVANYGSSDCSLTKLEILYPGAQQPFQTYSAADLEGMAARPGQPAALPHTKLAPGTTAIIYLWVTPQTPGDFPGALRHRISMKVGAYPEDVSVETAPLSVSLKPVPVLAPPLRGDNWLAGNGPSNTSGHRRALIPIDGRSWISQRFAIDWVQLFPDGGTSHGNKADNKSYRAYGQEALAVADGVVTEVKDGIPENVPGPNSRAVPITLETIGGNHVLLDLGNGIFAFYAHLQPGSIRVHIGDKVKEGQVLGLVGNSGNSTEPHLHFDICDRSSMLACEGLPYALPQFDVQGSGWAWKSAESKEAPVPHKMEIPLENQVVRFVIPPH
jgi:murein DD-endopeptidase